MLPSFVMKFPINRSYARLFVLTSLQALHFHTTVFTSEVLIQQNGAVVRNASVISGCCNSLVAY